MGLGSGKNHLLVNKRIRDILMVNYMTTSSSSASSVSVLTNSNKKVNINEEEMAILRWNSFHKGGNWMLPILANYYWNDSKKYQYKNFNLFVPQNHSGFGGKDKEATEEEDEGGEEEGENRNMKTKSKGQNYLANCFIYSSKNPLGIPMKKVKLKSKSKSKSKSKEEENGEGIDKNILHQVPYLQDLAPSVFEISTKEAIKQDLIDSQKFITGKKRKIMVEKLMKDALTTSSQRISSNSNSIPNDNKNNYVIGMEKNLNDILLDLIQNNNKDDANSSSENGVDSQFANALEFSTENNL